MAKRPRAAPKTTPCMIWGRSTLRLKNSIAAFDPSGYKQSGGARPRARARRPHVYCLALRLVLLLDLPGEPGQRVLAHHRLAGHVRRLQPGDGLVLALGNLVDVDVVHNLVVLRPDGGPALLSVLDAGPFHGLDHLVR